MLLLIEQFIVLYILTFCILMIYFTLRKKIKKIKDTPTTGMIYLSSIYKVDLKLIGIDKVEKHLSLINSFIIVVDLLIYFNLESVIIRLAIIFIATLLLIFIGYSILGNMYRKYRR